MGSGDKPTATSLTIKMDELFQARDMTSLRAMYHPNIESVKPNGEVIKGIDANFKGLEMLARQFPNMVITSYNFRELEVESEGPELQSPAELEKGVSEENKVNVDVDVTVVCSCEFDTFTECKNTGPQPPANSVYRIQKINTFHDGLLRRVKMCTVDTSAVICRQNQSP